MTTLDSIYDDVFANASDLREEEDIFEHENSCERENSPRKSFPGGVLLFGGMKIVFLWEKQQRARKRENDTGALIIQ